MKICNIKIVTCLALLLNGMIAIAQIQNGSFELWAKESDGSDVPAFWDYTVPNNDESIEISSMASDGNFAVNISSSNAIDGTDVGPAYLVTIAYPLSISNRISFDYFIDSLEGDCRGKVEVYFKNPNGNFEFLTEKSFDFQGKSYTSDFLDFELPYIDSILIGLVAENHYIPFGFDGFISILFDNIKLEVNTQIVNPFECTCTIVKDNISTNNYYFENDCFNNNLNYLLISQNGTIIKSGSVDATHSLAIPEGVYFLFVYNKSNFKKTYKLINLN